MPMMTMDAEHQCVPAAPLDLRTTNRECGSAECGIPDCKGRAGDARVRIPPAPPTSSRTHSVERFCPPVRDSLPGAENNASRKRPADKSSLRLPFRKRPIPVEPETQNRSPTPPQRGHRGSPATDQDFLSRERLAGRVAVQSRIISTPATRRNDEEEAHSPDGYPVRFLHPFDDYDVYPVYRVLPVPDQSHPLAHQTENLLLGISLATRQDEDGDTALHIAVVQGKLAIVHKLIQLLAHRSLDIYNNLRQTPLHLAVITQQKNMVEALLREGADPAALDRNGQTAIHLCCEYHQCDCLSVLLSCSSSSPCLEIRNYEGLSVLHLAVLRGHKDLARMLLDAGANINAMDIKSGQSPLMHAVENNNPDMVHFLIENGCDVNSQSYSGNTALHSACGRGQVETARLLLKSGADTSLKNYHNDTPVMVASTKKITDVLRGRASNQMRDQDQQCVSVSPHGSSFTKNGSASPSHWCGCSPAAASHTLQHRASHSPKTPSTPVFPFR